MYITDFLCTYNLIEIEEQDKLYRIQYLQAFGIDNWDNDIISSSMTELFKKIENDPDIIDIIDKIAKSEKFKMYIPLLGNNKENLFSLLFNFDLFHLSHHCFCDIINNKKIDKINKQKLLENL